MNREWQIKWLNNWFEEGGKQQNEKWMNNEKNYINEWNADTKEIKNCK